MKNFDLICLGEPLIEFNETSTGQYRQGIGGDINNCAVAAARSGLRVAMLGALGNDRFAQSIRRLWTNEQINADGVDTDIDHPTGLYFIHHDEQGHHFSYRRKDSAAAHFKLDDRHIELIKQAKILHISGISLAISDTACDSVYQAIAIAKMHGVRIAFDTNYRSALWDLPRARAVIHDVVGQADYVFPGLDDARLLTQFTTPQAIGDYYCQLGATLVALTMGGDGVVVYDKQTPYHLPAHAVTATDATAAGDTFDGAFLAELLHSGDNHAAARYANAAAALCVAKYGAIDAIPDRMEITRFLNATYASK